MKKGFTLIELLAVIVILAIIALIATPIILGIINDAKDDSNKRSVENYAHAVELAVARYASDNNGVIPTGEYTINGKFIEQGSTKIAIDYKGEELQGKVNIDAKGKISLSEIQFDGGEVYYSYTEEDGVTSNSEGEKMEEITSLIIQYEGKETGSLIYYKGSGDVVIPTTLNGIEIGELDWRAFMNNNVIEIWYEEINDTCQTNSSCDKAFLFLLDSSIEEDFRNYIENNDEYKDTIEIAVAKSSQEIVEKYNSLVQNDNIDMGEIFPSYYEFKDGQLVEDAIGYETEVTSIDLSQLNNIKTDEALFFYMTSLKTVKLPKIENFSSQYFRGNTSLEKIIVPYSEGGLPTTWATQWNYDSKLGKYHTVEYAG